MAVDRLSLLLESKTIGLEDVLRMEKAINRVIEQGQKARATGDGVAAATKAVAADSQKFGADFGQFVRDPIGAASEAAQGLVSRLGPVGIGLTAVGVAAVASGSALVSWIKSTGDAAEKILNLSITTGLSAKEVQLFQGALELSGASIEDLEKASIKLNQQLSDTSSAGQKARQALAGIGVSIYDSNGALKEAGPLLLDLSRGLSAIGDRSERDRVGVDLLGKSYRALIPAFTELSSNVQTLRRDGIGIDEKTLQQADALGDKLSRVNLIWSQQLTIIKAIVAQLADPVFDSFLQPGPSTAATFQFGALPIPGTQRPPGNATPEISARLFAPSPSLTTLIDPVLAGRLRGAATGSSSIESQRQQLGDLRSQIDSQRFKLGQLANTPGLTDEAASREVAALRTLEAQYKNLETAIKGAEDAEKRRQGATDLRRDVANEVAFGNLTPAQRRQAEAVRRFGPEFSGVFAPIVQRENAQRLQAAQSLARGATQNIPEGSLEVQNFRFRTNLGQEIAGQERVIENLGRAIAEGARGIEDRRDALRASVQFESERLRLIAGPGGELAAVRAIAQLRLDAIERELAITGDLRKADQERLQVFRDRQLEQLRIARERDDRNRQTGGQVFDALLSGGAGVGRFVSGLGLGFGRQIFGNTFAELARGTTGALQLPGQTGADGRPNFLGRVLSGTPFGLDPNKVSLDANTIATQQNTAALLGGRGGGILGSIPGVFGGGTSLSNPFVFSASGRSSGITGPDGLPLGIVGQGLGLGNPNLGLTLGQKIGAAAGAVGGGFLIKSGIQQGGVAGALDIGSGTAGALAALLPLIGVSGPAAPILAGAALGAQVVKSLLPDPRKARARSIQQAIDASRFDFGDGAAIDTDFARGGSLASTKGGIIVIQNISAADAQSFYDRRGDIAAAVAGAIAEGNTRINAEINRSVDLGQV